MDLPKLSMYNMQKNYEKFGIYISIEKIKKKVNVYIHKYIYIYMSFLLHTNISIYPKQLELKHQYQGEHATFLDMNITIKDNIFVYKLFDKRVKFPFFILRMPYLSSNIPSLILYGSIFSEFLRIARCTLRCAQLCTRMVTQGDNKVSILLQIRKIF